MRHFIGWFLVGMGRKYMNRPGASSVHWDWCQPPAVCNVGGWPKFDGRPWREGNEKRHGNLKECSYTRYGAPGAVLPLDAIPLTMTRRTEQQPGGGLFIVLVRDRLEKYEMNK